VSGGGRGKCNSSPSKKMQLHSGLRLCKLSVSLRGYSSLVEPQPSKLMRRVRFPLPAPTASAQVARFRREKLAHVAQLVEHTLGKGEVGSSNLLMSSIYLL
jgi:hypothetical protein